MSWSAVAAIAELLGALAVLASLCLAGEVIRWVVSRLGNNSACVVNGGEDRSQHSCAAPVACLHVAFEVVAEFPVQHTRPLRFRELVVELVAVCAVLNEDSELTLNPYQCSGAGIRDDCYGQILSGRAHEA